MVVSQQKYGAYHGYSYTRGEKTLAPACFAQPASREGMGCHAPEAVMASWESPKTKWRRLAWFNGKNQLSMEVLMGKSLLMGNSSN